MDAQADANVTEASIALVVTRGDGTVEDLGVVSYWHSRWWRRTLWKLQQAVK